MGKIRRFEELEAWKTARAATKAIYQVSSTGAFARDFALRDQVRRASISVMANIAEGFSRRSNREFIQFLFMAKASAAEVQSHLYVALDQGYVSQGEFQMLYEQVDQCARQVSAFITYLLDKQRSKTPRTQQTLQTQ